MALTRDQIWAAIEEIERIGSKPTLTAVRDTLGGGSFSTIQPALAEWKARKAAQSAPKTELAMPPAAAEKLQAFGVDVWSMAVALANRRLENEIEAVTKEREGFEAERAEVTELADQLTGDLEKARARITELESEVLVVHELRQRLAAAEARTAAIESAQRLRSKRLK